MRNVIVFLLGSWLVSLPYNWAIHVLNAYDGDKVNVIACQRVPGPKMTDRELSCQHKQAGFLGQPATKTPFRLRQITIAPYDQDCGESTCHYSMLKLVTEDGAIEVKDFADDRERADRHKARFETLLNQRRNFERVEMRYGNSWYKESLKFFLGILTVIVWMIVMSAGNGDGTSEYDQAQGAEAQR
jgi:hypothetical protein